MTKDFSSVSNRVDFVSGVVTKGQAEVSCAQSRGSCEHTLDTNSGKSSAPDEAVATQGSQCLR